MKKKKSPFEGSDLISVVLACAVVGGGLWLFANSMDSPVGRDQKPERVARDLPSRPIAPVPRKQAPAAKTQQPSRPAPVQGPSAQERRTLAKLIETCSYWTQRNQRGENEGFQTMACNDMRRFALQSNQPAPGVTIRKAAPKSKTSSVARRLRVTVDECGRYTYKSIDYRRCRAVEKDRLRKRCRHFTERVNVSRGDHRRSYLRQQDAWCLAYNQYLVIN
mgnify:CR=1 FL=1